jgi:hypothetical protein
LKKHWHILFLLLATQGLQAQHAHTNPDTGTIKDVAGLHRGINAAERQKAVAALLLGSSGGALLVLNEAWYKQYPRTRFQRFSDGKEWLQVDKAGHGWSAYQMGRAAAALWQWAGVPQKKAVLLGSAGSLFFLTVIEWMDGHAQKWGWSWADMAANGGGILLFAGQQLGWKEQRFQLRFSAVPQHYPSGLIQRRTELFGRSMPERILKDYNGQTYWLSANLKSLAPNSRIPAWLNMAAGYGAKGMWGGFSNRAFDPNGYTIFDRTDIARKRQWYLSPDVDFTQIKTNHKGLKTAFFLLNCIKFPAPALELSGKKLKWSWIQ